MQNFFELMQNLQEIKKMVEHSGKTPEQFLESLVSSGKYSQTQIDQAKNMAAMLQNILKGGRK